MFDAVRLPLTPNADSVPTLVMFGCEAVDNVPDTVVNTPLFPPILPTLALPVTVNEVNEPTLVMFGCAAVLNGPVNTLAPITPEFA